MADENSTDTITQTISDLVGAMGIDATIEMEDSITKGLVFNINTYDSYMLIGRQGSHLHALQILSHAMVARKLSGTTFPEFMIDVDDYKRKREWLLKETAKGAVEKARRTGTPVSLEPMPNFERKLIHSYLQEHFPEVTSDSVGFEPRRKIVIRISRP